MVVAILLRVKVNANICMGDVEVNTLNKALYFLP
jgi:hypothetical protein